MEGRSLEQVLWERANAPVTLTDIEGVLQATNRAAWELWAEARLPADGGDASLLGSLNGPEEEGAEEPAGPDLEMDQDRVVMSAAVGSTAHAKVCLCNTGSTALFYNWRAQDPTPDGMPHTGEHGSNGAGGDVRRGPRQRRRRG